MRIGIIGAGTMGVGIAHAVATSGWDALVVEPDDTQRDKARDRLGEVVSSGVSRGKLTQAEADAAISRLSFHSSAAELPEDLTGTVGVTAGASAPEWLVEEVLEALAPTKGVETVLTVEEDEYFPPPRDLRELLRAVTHAASVAVGSPLNGQLAGADDRDSAAAAMLAHTTKPAPALAS